jgi:hypothetical protein
MPNPWSNVHKSTAAMNYFFSNMTNTVICMTLGDLRIHHTTAGPFSTLHICVHLTMGWAFIFVFYTLLALGKNNRI